MQLTVTKIDRETDRWLLYGIDLRFYVITDPKIKVSIGDTIEYEEGGVNFGWFVRIVKEQIDNGTL